MSTWNREAAIAIAHDAPFCWIETRTAATLADVRFVA